MAFPATPLVTEVGLFLDGAWVNATEDNGWLAENGIEVRNGRSNWASQVDPARLDVTLDNRDGRWSPDYAAGAHFGDYRRNIPMRQGVGRGDPYLTYIGGTSVDVASTPDIAGSGGGSPTAPAFVDVTESEETSSTTTHTCDLSATMAADDRLLLIAHASHESLTATSDLDDWDLVTSGNLYTPWAGFLVYERGPLTSDEATALAGSSVDFTTTASVKSSFQVIRTSAARAGGLGVAYDFEVDASSTYSANPDPPSLTVDWGADEQRWYAIALYGSAGQTVSSYPSSYSSMADGHVTSLVQIASAHRTTSAATEDPGTYTVTGSENWIGLTFAYRATEDSSADGVLDITGDIDIRIEFQLDQDPGELSAPTLEPRIRLARKQAGADGWGIEIWNSVGRMGCSFRWHDSSGVSHFYETDLMPFRIRHDRVAIKVTLDVDDGSSDSVATFSLADRIGGTYAEIGTDTGEGVTSIKGNDAALYLAGRPEDQPAFWEPINGKTFAFELRDGIDGTKVVDADFTAQTVGASGFTDDATRVWTIGAGGRITDMRWRFHGELSSLPVRMSQGADHVWAPIQAAGLFRRLRQPNQRLESAIRRDILRSATNLKQYWPMEETGGGFITRFGAAVGSNAGVITGAVPDTGAVKTFRASSALPTPGDGVWTFEPDTYTPANQAWQLRWLQQIPTGFTGDNLHYFQVWTTDLVWEIAFRDDAGGQFRILAFRGLTTVYTGTWTSFNATGKAFRMQLWVRQNGDDLDINLEAQEPGEALGGGITKTAVVAGSAGTVNRIVLNKDSDVDDWAFGHLTLQDAVTNSTELAAALDAWTGETAGDRVIRLCREEGLLSRIEGDPADTEQMGPQLPETLMALLQECAETDLGILHEPRSVTAVGYRTRTSMVSQDTELALDWDAGEVAAPMELDRDDQSFANDVEVENASGSKARAVLDDGSALSVSEPPDGAGRYDKTFRVNGLDSRLQNLADSRLALSSPDEPRVSDLRIGLHHPALTADADLTDEILESTLGDLVAVSNNVTVALGSTVVRQLVQGTAEYINGFEHIIDYLTSPASPWDDTSPPVVTPPPAAHSVSFRTGPALATAGAPIGILAALGHTSTTPIARSELDAILDTWVAGTGGVTHGVTSAATATTAIGNALPGDLIRVTSTYDPGGSTVARGDLYGIAGATLTSSTDGGEPGLPIIITCADGVDIDENDPSGGGVVLDLVNCRHVWAVGVNVKDSQFGIRTLNWGGTDGFPAYVAYCDIQNIGDAGLTCQGWWQLITSSGGTPPAGAGNEWGYSEFFVLESNTVDGVGVDNPNTGECIYLGRGSTPGWVSYAKDGWVRGNTCNDWTSDAVETKPGCLRIRWTDNDIHVGHAINGSPFGILYVAVALDLRPAAFAIDPQIWVEGNRIHDSDLTNVDASSVHIMGYIGLSGCRIANNILWAKPETGGAHAMWRARHEHGANDTEALTAFRNDPTWVINNTSWGDDTFENAGYGNPFVGAFPGTIDFDLRNNICDQASPATGEVDASSADFIATVPAIGVAADAEWLTYGHGSAFDLALASALIGAGADISDIGFYIERDISDRAFDDKTKPNPGAFQPHPANL